MTTEAKCPLIPPSAEAPRTVTGGRISRQYDHPPEGGAALDVGARCRGLGERELLVDDDAQRTLVHAGG